MSTIFFNFLKNRNFFKLIACALSGFVLYNCSISKAYAENAKNVDAKSSENIQDSEQQISYEETLVTTFTVENLSPKIETDLDYTDWWYCEWENCHYIFLPATADRSNLLINYTIENSENSQIYLNGKAIVSGEITSILSQADEFTVTVGDTDCGVLKIMQSNLGCIYLTTESGGTDKLDANKGFVDTGSALMLNSNGGIEYDGELEKIKKHGNSSWDYSKKKPYNIKLPQKANLYGMGKAKKWALLGNYLDHSMLRNTMTQEIARAVGIDYIMDSVFVDLYADGSYRGTYQLSERVQVQKNRVNITDLEEKTEALNDLDLEKYERVAVNAGVREYKQDSYKYYDIPNNPKDITGGYLLEFKMAGRYPDVSSGFVTKRGQAVEIVGPEYASKEQVLYIKEFMQDLEDAIYSSTGYNSKGKHYSDYIDVDSLIKGYLIEEISMDIDGYCESFFFWKESDSAGDGKLHCGPVWDFDFAYYNYNAIRNNWDGDVGYSWELKRLFAAYFPISGYNADDGKDSITTGVSWIGTLYKRGDIVKRTAEIYFKDFYPYLNKLTDTEQDGGALLTKMGEKIQPSAEMNNARWHMYGDGQYKVFGPKHGDNFTECVDFLRNFIVKRSDWLADLWQPMISENASYIKGDVNMDGVFNQQDLKMLQQWLHASNGRLTYWKAADFNNDGMINIYDLCLMKRALKN